MLNFYIWSLCVAVKSRWKVAAILYGLALASKWSSLYGIVPLAFIYLHQNKISLKSILLPLRLLLIAISVYVLSFTPFILTGHSWAQWWELHRQMWYYHTHLVATHGYQSTPLQWVFDALPVWYWVKYSDGSLSNIYALGNPLVLWLGLVALITQIKKIVVYPSSLFYLLAIIFTLPWIISPRIMFFYHYLPSATFLCIILATWVVNQSKKYLLLILLLSSISLLLISPLLYGFATPSAYWDMVFRLVPSWK